MGFKELGRASSMSRVRLSIDLVSVGSAEQAGALSHLRVCGAWLFAARSLRRVITRDESYWGTARCGWTDNRRGRDITLGSVRTRSRNYHLHALGFSHGNSIVAHDPSNHRTVFGHQRNRIFVVVGRRSPSPPRDHYPGVSH